MKSYDNKNYVGIFEKECNLDIYFDDFDDSSVFDKPRDSLMYNSYNKLEEYFDTQKGLDDYFNCELNSISKEDYVFKKLNSIKDNLIIYTRKGMPCIKQLRVYCPECFSKNVKENGYYGKTIVVDGKGDVEVNVKRYGCNHCGNDFSADLTSIVRLNSSVSNVVLDKTCKYFSIFEGSVRKIKEALEEMNNVTISHQEVQDILVHYCEEYVSKIDRYSGYYAFDSLWIKIDELSDEYVYLLVLIDTVHRCVVAYKIVEEETEEVIYDFLREATRNQDRIAITTDLKQEYRKPISDLKFTHQFCVFHAKKSYNTFIRKYVKDNGLPEEKIDEYKGYLPEICEFFYAESREEVLKIVNNLMKNLNKFPEVIQQIIKDKIRPNSGYLTRYIEDLDIDPTSNTIERIFEHTMGKRIKNKYKTVKGFMKRFNIKVSRWEERNVIFQK